MNTNVKKIEHYNGCCGITIETAGGKYLVEVDNNENIINKIKENRWHLKHKKYLYCSKLKKSLHHLVMEEFYGKAVIRELIDNGYVIDHIDNKSFDNRISKLYYIIKIANSHKGQRLDKKRASQGCELFTLSLYNMYPKEQFIIKICFNELRIFLSPVDEKNKQRIVQTLEFIYNRKHDDYKIVIDDATLMYERLLNSESIKDLFNEKDYRADETKLGFCDLAPSGMNPGQVYQNEKGENIMTIGSKVFEDETKAYCYIAEIPPKR
jgi:hypothetical protein